MADELVFHVSADRAVAASSTTLAAAGLREREHLQEWVLANPEILGAGIMVITCEFDRWESRAGVEKDRLDVLGLDRDGRLVVAELKRDVAPDTVEMQAIKYAAMASRFDIELLADAYAEFSRKHRTETLTSEEASEALLSHTEFRMSDETLRAPRIVIVAGGFPSNVTATAVWLSEMGLDITLTRVQAYDTPGGVVITVSQHYPPADVGAFIVAPTRSARRARSSPELPQVEWTMEDLVYLAGEVNNTTIHTTMTLGSQQPEEWLPAEAVQAATGRELMKHRGDYGGFGVTLRTRFKRSNAPFEVSWAEGGTNQQYYRVTTRIAEMWRTVMRSNGDALHDSAESLKEP